MDEPTRTFEITTCLGRGGFGEVYRARMRTPGGDGTEVALKVLRRDIDPDGQAVQRLRDEGRLLARLNHPAILKVHDLLVLDGRIALVTEYLEGADLSTCLEGADPLGPRGLLEVVASVASALHAAWTVVPEGDTQPLRMVHRDIKPSNIRLSRHGGVKLLDFGIARTDAVDREARTRTDMMVGSPAYMAPERFLDREIRLASDVFSLGAVLYEGLSGRRFWGDLTVPLQVGIAFDRARYQAWLDERLAGLAVRDDVLGLVRSALALDPDTRPTPGAFAIAAEALADEIGGPTLERWCRAHDWPKGSVTRGDLEGRSLTEGTLETRLPPSRRPTGETTGTWGWALVGVGGTGVLGVALTAGALLLAALVGLGVLWTWAPGTPARPVDPAETPALTALPTGEVLEAPAPVVGQAGRVAPSPVPRPVPQPAPVAPVAPAGPPPGRIALEGDVVASVVTSAGEIVLPADVPPGTWRLKAKFNGRDAVDAGSVTVASGQTVTFQCSTRMVRCTRR